MKKLILILVYLNLLGCEVDFSTRINTEKNKKVIATDKAPKAIGPYSQAIEIDNTLYLAGQIGLDPASGKLVDGGIEKQTDRVMKNLQAVLYAAGYTFDNVVQTQVFVADLNDYKAMNDVYAKYFSDAPPARAAVQAVLPRGALVEIMMVAKR
ncbi:MAG: RidA family protein [Candidatus Neomarinimicrobiota bacterium]|nr:RidA family protein [Candidatus Neomarinimicrobiota bacterium]